MSKEDITPAILSYWTPERMAAAQPVPIVMYGTEYIEKTVVAEDTLRSDKPELPESQETVQGAGPLQPVPDDKVKTFPYQSVGKLFFNVGESHFTASAWVVSSQLHIVMTAAHCLKPPIGGTATNILFIPGFIPPDTKVFGSYPQIPGGEGVAWAVDPNWDPNNIQAKYDLGMIKLDKDLNTGKYVDEVVKAIPMLSKQPYTSKSEWNTIGYPPGKMHERSGTLFAFSDVTLYKYGTVLNGMSGGPWIYAGSDGQANGIHSGIAKKDTKNCDVSPYFASTVDELVKLYFHN